MIGAEDVREALEDVIARNPNRVNPATLEGSFMYTDANGDHCLLGEALVKLGIDVPVYGSASNVDRIDLIISVDDFTATAIALMKRVQLEADGCPSGHPLPWRDIRP